MGIRLIVEILDHWQDWGLTAGERSDLLVIAENAKDSTRETFGPIHEDYILKRVGKKAAAWRVAIAALKSKGVLEYAVRDGREMSGRPGQFAVYRLAVLCPEAPHDGLRGQCTRPERVSSQLTHSEPADEAMGYPTANASDGMGYPSATQRVSRQLTPSPQVPSVTTSSLSPNPPASPDPEPSPAPVERETASSTDKATTAQQIIRATGLVTAAEEQEFISWARITYPPAAPAFWRKVDKQGDLPELVEAWRNSQPKRPTLSLIPAWCGHCNRGTEPASIAERLTETADGRIEPCTACHPKRRTAA